jgi:hypothetical protein
MNVKKIHRSSSRKINSEMDFDIFEDQFTDELNGIFDKTLELEDKALQDPLIDFMIIRLVAGFESGMKTLCAFAFDEIKTGNSYDFDDIQIPIRDLKKIDNLDIEASSLFASSFNFQNPYVINSFFSNIFKKDLWDLFRKFLQINPTLFDELVKMENEVQNEIIQSMISSHSNINKSIDEFIEMFNIRNQIAHKPSFSSKMTLNQFGKMWMLAISISMFIMLGIIAKSPEIDEETIGMVKKYKINELLQITFDQ